jgi:ribonuclease Z
MASSLRTAAPCSGLHYGNVPLLEHHHEGLTVRGFSRAAVQTYWAVPELKIIFDHGAPAWDLANLPRLALTHAHPDHLAGLVSYVATRAMFRQAETKIFLPSQIVTGVRELLDSWEKLTNDQFRPELIGCAPGDVVPLGGAHTLRPFKTTHVIPSQGYVVSERRQKLKPKYEGLSGAKIGELKRAGVEVATPVDVDLVAFSGDTTIAMLDDNPWLYRCKVLIMEITYVGTEPDPPHARRYGHVHLDDVVERASLFENELIVLGHFSTRLKKNEILETLAAKLPEDLLARCVAWL